MQQAVPVSRQRMVVTQKRLRRFEVAELWISRVIVWFMLALVMFPILYVVASSFQTGGVFTTDSLIPDPRLFTLKNYQQLFADPNKFPRWVRNSVLMATAVGTIQVAVTVTSSFAFSRLRFWGRTYGIRLLLLLQMMPTFVSLAAIQYALFKLDLASPLGLLMVYSGASAWNIWLIKGYMDGLPRELDEAARVDGCTDWQVFTKVILPLSRPMLAVIFLFTFTGTFSEFIMASSVLRDNSDWMLAQGLRTYVNNFSTDWGKMSAAVLLASLPLATIWMFAQKFVESGLTRGAIKG